MKNYWLMLMVLLLANAGLWGQNGASYDDIQWACEVLDCSQKYEGEDYSAKKVLGTPDVYLSRPRASSNGYLFGWREKEDDEARGEVFVTVKFCNPLKASRVLVAENSNPGTRERRSPGGIISGMLV